MADMFKPKLDANGLLTAVVTHAETGELLMVAHMNEEAIAKTRETGRAHFWSRSRQSLWLKGESSGHFLNVVSITPDCDNDILLVLANGTQRFSGLRRKIGGVSEKMLAQTLQWLEQDGLVLRQEFPVVPPHVEYSLTPMGAEAAEHVRGLADWIELNLQRIIAGRATAD